MELLSFMLKYSTRVQAKTFVCSGFNFRHMPSNQIFFKLFWKQELPSLELSNVQKFPWIYFLNVIFYYYLTLFPSFLSFAELYPYWESIYRGISDFLFHVLLWNYASFFLSQLIFFFKFHHLWKVLSWLNQGCWKSTLWRYSTFHNSSSYSYFNKFGIPQVNFVPICLKV